LTKIAPQRGAFPNSWLPVSSVGARVDAWRQGVSTPAARQDQAPASQNAAAQHGNAGGNGNGLGGGAR